MMEQIFSNSSFIGIAVSLAGYFAGTVIKKRFKLAIFNPLLIAIVFVIVFLLLFNVDYGTYYISGRYLSYLLTPATVCLAIPLYQKMELLKKHAPAIITGVISGVLVSLVSVFVLARLFGLTYGEYITLLPKSVTTAIGLDLSALYGGFTDITAAVIILTGVFGNITAEFLCRLFKFKYPISRGIAIGTASHAVGTSKAIEMGETEGAMSSLAIAVSGLCTVAAMALFAGIWK